MQLAMFERQMTDIPGRTEGEAVHGTVAAVFDRTSFMTMVHTYHHVYSAKLISEGAEIYVLVDQQCKIGDEISGVYRTGLSVNPGMTAVSKLMRECREGTTALVLTGVTDRANFDHQAARQAAEGTHKLPEAFVKGAVTDAAMAHYAKVLAIS